MKFKLIEDYQEYKIDDKNVFNVARIFSSDYIPDNKTVKYFVKVFWPFEKTYKYSNKEKALKYAEDLIEKDEESTISVDEIIYNEDGSIYNEETIFDYWY